MLKLIMGRIAFIRWARYHILRCRLYWAWWGCGLPAPDKETLEYLEKVRKGLA